ncbi:MAG: zinc ABC transporter substrate-binding protein [Methanobacterium sp.]|uniref:metal ABC transporter solute-binding protein, Zn/Mn family n=1 Tax=Methanobacterium sp. TaxID=2164 RepID=UPI003D65546F|nr:zinc ABC transporter substrate-binding protein [Methanobacterium sp.]
MEKRRIIIIFALIIGILLLGSVIYYASPSKSASNEGKISLIVTVPPQAEFAEKIGGDKVKVTVMVPPGANPHTYEPLPEQLKEVSNAQIYAQVGSGIEFENVWMEKINSMNKNIVIINCSNGITFISNNETSSEHSEGLKNQYDTHVWVSPKNAKTIVENIYKTLVQIDPANRDYYTSNKDKYLKELDNTDKKINESISGNKNRIIMVYHPSWGYFCRDYGLTQVAIEKNGKEPSPQEIATLIDIAQKDNIKIIFISPQFSRKSADMIASEIGGQVIVIDDMDKNYISNLNNVAEAFKKALN